MGNTQAPVETGTIIPRAAPSVLPRNSKSTVRILVVGRTGSGKSTLIRMLVGNKGPRAIRHGVIVQQDITKEWKHPDPDLPFIIHDSNGVTGGQRKDEIESFLGKCQESSKVLNDISQRVHVLWYVFSAVDNRIKNDDGLLEMLKRYGKELPILLIMTHDTYAKAIGNGMAEKVMEDVLECISGDNNEWRSKLQESMVRVENNISVDKGGEIVKEISVDKEALSLVVERTKELASFYQLNSQQTHNHENGDGYTVGSGEPSCSDPSERIQRAYENLISQDKLLKEDLEKTFKEVRILVVGKTGSGKTTLIRMLLGDKGPRSIQHGVVGEQDIRREWKHPDLPFIIHDSNGVDTLGESRTQDIKRFLGERQAYDKVVNEFGQRVHAVWYVFSALDNRVKDDHGLLETLASYGKELPLMLIMTHHKRATAMGNIGMVEQVMEEVLECIPDEQGNERRRCRLRESMVRVENNVEVDREGEIVKEMDVDKVALTLVVERTKALMEEELWMTWAACQAVSMKMKVEASVSLVLEKRYHQWLATIFVGLFPIVHQGQMALMFTSFTHGLAMIWRASPNLEMAIVSCKCFRSKLCWDVISNLGRNTMAALAILSIVMTALVTTGIVAIGVPAGATVLQFIIGNLKQALVLEYSKVATKFVDVLTYIISEPDYTSKLLLSYGLVVLGAIMYAHVHDLNSIQPRSVDHYSRLFAEFLGSPWFHQISAVLEGCTSMSDAATLVRDEEKKRLVLPDDEKQRLLLDVSTFFEKLCREEKL